MIGADGRYLERIGPMKLVSFRVQMFKAVIDSCEVRVTPLTVLVGKNESGKTTLLKALHKLNPALAEPYKMTDEWPRGHREKRSEDHVPCWATFHLSSDEVAQLANTLPDFKETSVRVGRTYGNKLRWDFSETISAETEALLSKLLPKFVFMDEYQVFRGTAYLDQVKQRVVDQNTPQPEDRALLTILSLAGLNLQGQWQAATQSDKTERQYDLSDGSATITKRMASHWKQMAYEVELQADGMQFWTFVKAPGDKAQIKLEERSRGFQWFFSFDAKLLHETGGILKDCVLLLDEPGLHLHASAQRDLLTRLEEYAEGNVMIYTSHLPFMINLREPDRIRVLGESTDGVTVSEELSAAPPEARLTLQAALGMNGHVGMPAGEKNLVVEGVHDYWILSTLSNLFHRCGEAALPHDFILTAAMGAHEVTYLAMFMLGQELQVVALYDSDHEGRTAHDKLIKNWLTRYKNVVAAGLLLADAAGIAPSDGAIEDLFPPEFYWRFVEELYRRQIPEELLPKFVMPSSGPLAQRAESALASVGLKFNKGSVAKRMCGSISGFKAIDELPAETVTRVKALFKSIRDSFAKETR